MTFTFLHSVINPQSAPYLTEFITSNPFTFFSWFPRQYTLLISFYFNSHEFWAFFFFLGPSNLPDLSVFQNSRSQFLVIISIYSLFWWFHLLSWLYGASQVTQWWKNPSANARDAGYLSLIPGSGRSLEEEMTTHSSIRAVKIPWTEELLDYSPWGCKEWDTTGWLSRGGHDLYAANSKIYILSPDFFPKLFAIPNSFLKLTIKL